MVVIKFGGSSVANIERIRRAAALVSERYINSAAQQERDVAIVVSAMYGVTDTLNGYINTFNDYTNTHTTQYKQENDMVLSAGEQVAAALFAMALNENGHAARSFLGWQIPIISTQDHCNARIAKIPTENLDQCLQDGIIPVITGFQGITENSRITTLGRGGSDTTAVALAVALGATRCDIYTDVSGVFTADPKKVPCARRISSISFEEVFEMAFCGAKVLQYRSVEIAMRHGMNVRVLSTFNSGGYTEFCVLDRLHNEERARDFGEMKELGGHMNITANGNGNGNWKANGNGNGNGSGKANGNGNGNGSGSATWNGKAKDDIEKISITGITSKTDVVMLRLTFCKNCNGANSDGEDAHYGKGANADENGARDGKRWAVWDCEDKKSGSMALAIMDMIASTNANVEWLSCQNAGETCFLTNAASADALLNYCDKFFAKTKTSEAKIPEQESPANFDVSIDFDVAIVSVIGIGIGGNNEIIKTILATLSQNGVAVLSFVVTPLSVRLVTKQQDVTTALTALHSALIV
jgi:aspartokinase